MAKSVETKQLSEKDLNKFLGGYLFKSPEKSVDGSIKTARYETGIIMLDLLLNGGLPRGRAVAIGAEWGVGKTTMLIHACANIVKMYDKKVYYIDAEGGATYELWEAMGVAGLLYDPENNPDGKIYLLGINTIQDIAAVIKKVIFDPETAVIVIDSDTQVADQLAIDDEILGTGKNDAGSNARMWSKVSRTLNAIVSKSDVSLVIVHQARVDLSDFRPRVVASGGNALKHLVSVEVWGKRISYIGEGNVFTHKKSEAIGSYVRLTTEKNRLTKPFANVYIPIIFGRGVANKWAYKEWLENHTYEDKITGEVRNVLDKAGAGWYTLTLPSGQHKCRGDKEIWEIIDANLPEIKEYVDSNGGFSLSYGDAEGE